RTVILRCCIAIIFFALAKQHGSHAEIALVKQGFRAYLHLILMVPVQRRRDMATNSRGNGFFRNAIDAMMAARERQASRCVASALLRLDDETLRAQGYNRADLKKASLGGYMF